MTQPSDREVPAQTSNPLALDGIRLRGDYSFVVFNDDYQQMPLSTVPARARRSALCSGEDVLQRAGPLPSRIRLQRNAG